MLIASIATSNTRLYGSIGLMVVLLLVSGAVYLRGDDAPSPEELAAQAISAVDSQQRNQAAAQLAVVADRRELPRLRQVYQQSSDPAVRATVMQSMGRLYDYDSMDSLLEAMDDPSPLVRARANAAVVRMIGLDGHFDANGPIEDRRRIIGFYRLQWESMRNSPGVHQFEDKMHVRYGGQAQ